MRMSFGTIPLWSAAVALCVASVVGCNNSSDPVSPSTPLYRSTPVFRQTNLVSDTAGQGAAVIDQNVVNPWGIVADPRNGGFWTADNHSGLLTAFGRHGEPLATVVPVLKSDGTTGGAPTGLVRNTTGTFGRTHGSVPMFFIGTEDGDIAAWPEGAATASVVASVSGASFKGITMSNSGAASRVYAADFANNRVDVFDASYAIVNSFTDHGLPAGYGPFNVAMIGDQIFVAFALRNSATGDEIAGPGNGYVSVFAQDGSFIKRLASNGPLNAPWAMVEAPSTFGQYAGQILVGNFGDGKINVFSVEGANLGPLLGPSGQPIVIEGLWGLAVATTNAVYFAAGIDDENHGLIGTITRR